MTDHGGAASPRTDPRDDDRDLRGVMTGAVWVAPSIALALLDRAQKAEAALEAAQEAPAPEGLRQALATLVDAVERPNAPDSEWLDEAVLRAKRALAATPPTPAEPPRTTTTTAGPPLGLHDDPRYR